MNNYPDEVYVTNMNPVTFFVDFADKVTEGFYAVPDSVDGAPRFEMVYEIKLFAVDTPEIVNVLDARKRSQSIASYDNTEFVLALQDAIVQGWILDAETLDVTSAYGLLIATLHPPKKNKKD